MKGGAIYAEKFSPTSPPLSAPDFQSGISPPIFVRFRHLRHEMISQDCLLSKYVVLKNLAVFQTIFFPKLSNHFQTSLNTFRLPNRQPKPLYCITATLINIAGNLWKLTTETNPQILTLYRSKLLGIGSWNKWILITQ